jgi:hypothetical protein
MEAGSLGGWKEFIVISSLIFIAGLAADWH